MSQCGPKRPWASNLGDAYPPLIKPAGPSFSGRVNCKYGHVGRADSSHHCACGIW